MRFSETFMDPKTEQDCVPVLPEPLRNTEVLPECKNTNYQ